MSDFNTQIIEEFRANEGKVGGMFEGSAMLILTTTGAKTGRTVSSPLVYLPDGDRIVIIASNGGADRNPAWYHNIKANPVVTIEVGADKYEAKAQVVTDRTERDALFARMVERAPGFADYERKTERLIPVIAVNRNN
ncbi:nitroreductase family deazaflavin-dependent oxidoreductase [Kibdelosporangium philippinense]|uniref:Nitroreductase family deazaflavin-dependent oxidoreductase n=1 Tax=Kibdelosporangium philippinense TaxID=211113 RepID=A0ABS8ZC56_9PSEU|nr:nitroreductase family deazaflavin-dependent oxidoreductase [Kibdelosporangium philippinense]MCE7005451.1 nitroreductase family deazaflavin-dependent oxidoreductase [Kibdelosporangium philippinense]